MTLMGSAARWPTHVEAMNEARLAGQASQAEDLFRLAAESLPSGVLVVNADGEIVFANDQLERQFGYSHGELIGQPIDVLVPELLQDDHSEYRQGFEDTQEIRPMGTGLELFGRRRDGREFPIDVGLNRITTDEGVFVLASVVDITGRRELEAAARHTIETQLEFERLIAELSFKSMNLPSDELIDAIRDALSRIGETLDVDRCAFFRMRGGEWPLVPIAFWARPGVKPPPVVASIKGQFPWVLETILAGQMVSFGDVAEVPSSVDRVGYEAVGIRSAVTLPLSVGGRIVGAIGFNMVRSHRSWSPETLHTMRFVAAIFSNILARAEGDDALSQAITQVERQRDELRAENAYLRREVEQRQGVALIVGDSPAVRRVMEQAQQVASTDSTVLLLGETGTGKELIASHIHDLSARHGRLMVRVNCSAIPSTLMESELFGREKGAFTGALARQIGRFELAERSTIFLDEIGDLPGEVQVKLLRVLEERKIERLGSPKPIPVDVRIIAATHRNLEKRIAEDAFREDLFYRLNVFPIHIPPLRDRVEDIPLLVWRFVDEFSKVFSKRVDAISREDMAALQRHAWPGNIRELRNVVERAMIVSSGGQLKIPLPAAPSHAAVKRSIKLNDVEKEHIRGVLESTGWRIRGLGGAADCLGLRPTTLEARMAKLGLSRPKRQ
jgi:formate hydrogenlyase transcriptional activator